MFNGMFSTDRLYRAMSTQELKLITCLLQTDGQTRIRSPVLLLSNELLNHSATEATPLQGGVVPQHSPIWGSFPFMHTPFITKLPNLKCNTWGGGLFLEVSYALTPMGQLSILVVTFYVFRHPLS